MSSELVFVRKPDPEAFAEVARRMGVTPEEVLFFDDTEENVIGARAAGLRAVLFRTVEDASAALARIR